MSAQLTLAVIGHVNHGKTALVRALTGTDTDRLPEERARGMSIALGFAHIDSAAGCIDLIDAPGHERFVRTMIGGATGVDGVVLVVDAREGFMPQTREHVDIARLLGLDRGIVAISKIDRVDAGAVTAIGAGVRARLAGTFLARAPLVPVSVLQPDTISALHAELALLAHTPIERGSGRGFYLPVDRVFSVVGHGTVVTGTLRGGCMASGGEVEVQPGGRRAFIRQLQTHGRTVEQARPGQRVAVNLRHIERGQISRGAALAAPGLLRPSRYLDAQIEWLPQAAPLANGAEVRLLVGTTEVLARVRLLDRDTLDPGASAPVQLRCRAAVATQVHEPCILRSDAPSLTLGGGRILDPLPPRHRRHDPAVARRLTIAARGGARERLLAHVADADLRGIELTRLAQELAVAPQALPAMLAAAPVRRLGDRLIVDTGRYAWLLDAATGALRDLHAAEPLRGWFPRTALHERLGGGIGEVVLGHALEDLAASGRIDRAGAGVRLAGHDPLSRLSAEERELARRIEHAIRAGGLAPPDPAHLLGADPRGRRLLQLLTGAGRLVVMRGEDGKSTLLFHPAAIEDARARLARIYPPPRRFTVAQARTVLASTRKFVLPLMEYFDGTGVTLREGDVRQLRRSS
jgi:selenocysteine-specific elongation factor